jgi:hypothetical protein
MTEAYQRDAPLAMLFGPAALPGSARHAWNATCNSHGISRARPATEAEMNVSAIASLISTAISAGSSASRTASKEEAAAPQSSTQVSLSDGTRAEPLTYTKSKAGSLLGTAELLLPTRANAAMLAKKAGEAINAKLDAAGIPREPGFEVAIEDVNSAHVTVKGDRADAKAIEDLINGDKALQMDIHNAYALASHIPAIERATAFDQEYRAAQTKAQMDAVIARYSDLFSGFTPAADVHMNFGKDGLQMAVNGTAIHA